MAEYFGEQHRAQWKTQAGFIFAAMGSAIGLGNIWRFPYLCYENGGGAFLIPYFIALFAVGIPIMILEFAIGHREKGSAPLSFHKISPKWEWLGWWSVIFVMFGIMFYYPTIISWCVNYFRYSFNLAWGEDPNSFFFAKFLALTGSPGIMGDIRTPILLGLIFVWFFMWLIVYSGVEKGIERANKIMIPVLFILTLTLVIWSVRLPGSSVGIKKYLRPDFAALKNPRVWIAAFSQIFFTLSLGFGIMIAYASYLPRKTNITASAILTSVGNCLYSFLAGFAVWGTLGYMATLQNQPIEKVVSQSIGLAFVAYPKAISMLPSFNTLFGAIFFTILVFAGITSGISIIEAISSAIMDKFHYPRKRVASVICLAGFLGSIPFATGGGLYYLDIVDHFINSYGLVTVGFLECVLLAWIFKIEKLRAHINEVSPTKTGYWWEIFIKYITPVVLVILIVSALFQEFASPYGGYPVVYLILLGRDWLAATAIAAVIVSQKSWG